MTDKAAPSVPPVEAQLPAWLEVQAGDELKHLVEVIRFAPGQPTGFLHSPHDAHKLLWRWFLKWQAEAAALPFPQGWQPIEMAPKDGTRIRLLTPFCDAGGRRCYEMFTGSWQTNDFGSFWEDEECAEESHPEYWRPLDAAPIAAPRGVPQDK